MAVERRRVRRWRGQSSKSCNCCGDNKMTHLLVRIGVESPVWWKYCPACDPQYKGASL